MGIPIITADLIVTQDPDVLVRDHARLMRALLHKEQLIHWKERMPKRFTNYVISALGGRKRAKWYQIWKAKRYGTTMPNVKTGVTRTWVLRQTPRITATPKRSTMRIALPFSTSGRFKQGGTARQQSARDLARERVSEMEAITAGEIREIAGDLKTRYVKAVNTKGFPRRLRKRS